MRPPVPLRSISRRTKIIVAVVVLLIVILSVLSSLVRLYVDWLWFGETGYRRVFSTGILTRLFLFFAFGALVAVIVAGNLALAYRVRPPFRPASGEQQSLERYRAVIEPRRRLIAVLVSLLLGLFVGLAAQGKWETWLLWRHAVRFGVNDPQFGWDISYFVFTYPLQRFVLGILFAAVLLSLFGALAVHYLYGGVRWQGAGEKITLAARAHLSVLLGVFLLLKAVAYVLDRYGLVFSDRGGITGASYTDVKAVLPAKTILVIVALICAVAVIANVVLRNVLLPAIAVILLVFTSVAISGIYPALVQQFSVRPNADQKEKTYIGRNIVATRQAYGIASTKAGGPIDYIRYNAKTEATAPQLRADTATIPNARLLDPNILSPTFTQFQQIRNVYGFADKLDVDRYAINGKNQDYVVGVRELVSADLTGNQQNWINRHLVFTHGNGFVAAAANQDLRSQSEFVEGDIPPSGPIPIKQSRIYYGERLTDYSIVGARPGEPAREFDRPSGEADEKSTYAGKGGVTVGGAFRRLVFAAYYRQRNILLSGAINPSSRILFVRDPADRVQKVAPFLKIDGDPYPAVVDGRIVWIVDGYTSLNSYPYSQHETLRDVTADSLNQQQGDLRLADQEVNYIRNSVKATVDAYDGTVTLYEWDSADPLLKTWERVYPGIVRPRSEIGSDLQAHFRYPEDLFKVQRKLITKYHVDDPVAFFNSQDFWAVPDDPAATTAGDQPPYYILAQAPGQERPTFQLTSALNALNRPNLAAYVTVSSDPQDYGKIRVLELPGNQAVLGPVQVFGKFNATAEISQTRSLLDQRGSRVVFGNLLTLPAAGGLLYVEPLYVEAAAAPYPLLQKVLVAFGSNVAIGDNLPQALDKLFGAGAGQGVQQGGQGPSSPAGGGGTSSQTSPAVAQAVRDIQQALADLRAAYRTGNLAAIGAAEEKLQRAADAFERASSAAAQPTSTPTGTPAPSRSP